MTEENNFECKKYSDNNKDTKLDVSGNRRSSRLKKKERKSFSDEEDDEMLLEESTAQSECSLNVSSYELVDEHSETGSNDNNENIKENIIMVFSTSPKVNENYIITSAEVEESFYSQITQQLLTLTKCCYKSVNTCEEMSFLLPTKRGKVKLIAAKKDGNCLFRSIAHQLFRETMNSKEQDNTIKQLRKDVVQHIRANMNNFTHELIGAVYERTTSKVTNMTGAIESFLTMLAEDHTFAGSETTKAISFIYKVNVIIISEDGSCQLGSL